MVSLNKIQYQLHTTIHQIIGELENLPLNFTLIKMVISIYCTAQEIAILYGYQKWQAKDIFDKKCDAQAADNIKTSATELYHQFRTLLLPYLGNYFKIQQMLNQKDPDGNRPHDYLPIDCLKPESNWFGFCSIL